MNPNRKREPPMNYCKPSDDLEHLYGIPRDPYPTSQPARSGGGNGQPQNEVHPLHGQRRGSQPQYFRIGLSGAQRSGYGGHSVLERSTQSEPAPATAKSCRCCDLQRAATDEKSPCPPHLASTDVIIDRKDPLGSGAFSCVFGATLADDAPCAKHARLVVKVFNGFIDQKKFTKEVQHQLALDDAEKVVPLLAYVNEATSCTQLIVMPRADCTLDKACRGCQNPKDLAQMLRHVVRCLQYLHGHDDKVLHLDLKPSNILVTGRQPRLADMGTAYAMARTLGGASSTLTSGRGTVPYMDLLSMEHEDGWRPEPANDVYSLGALLWEIVSGTAPWSHLPEVTQTRVFKKMEKGEWLGRPVVGHPALQKLSAAALQPLLNVIERAVGLDKRARPSLEEIERALGTLC